MGRTAILHSFMLALLLAFGGMQTGAQGKRAEMHAKMRGIRVIPVTTQQGRTVNLYKGSHALLVGVSDYTAGWPKLESIPGELDRLEVALIRQGFSVTRVKNPNSRQLENAFKDFIDQYGYEPENRLLFFYSGHGYTRTAGRRRKGYLVPADAPDPNRDPRGFLRKALTMSQVQTWAREIEAKHALFLFDSCFSGTIFKTRALPVPRHITDKTVKPVRQFITAGSAGEEVPARSVFLPTFIRAIEGDGDVNRDGYVTGTELGQYLHQKVMAYDTGQTPQFGKINDPDLDEGDFVFPVPRRPSGPVTAAVLPKGPGKSSFNLSDIQGVARRQKASRRAWANNLVEMKSAFGQVQTLEKDPIDPNLKATAWARFLDAFRQDNPYTAEDEALRKTALARIAHWKRSPKKEAMAWFRKGEALFNGRIWDEPQKALDHYSKAIAAAPNFAKAYAQRGRIYSAKVDWEKARRDFDQALRIDPSLAEAYYGLGNILRRSEKNFEGAIEKYTEAIRLKPEFIAAYFNRGLSFLNINKYRLAIEDYDRVIELNSKFATAFQGRGAAYVWLKQYRRAIKDYDRAIDLNPKLASPYYGRGLSYEYLGEKRLARKDYRKSCDMGNKRACKNLKNLR